MAISARCRRPASDLGKSRLASLYTREWSSFNDRSLPLTPGHDDPVVLASALCSHVSFWLGVLFFFSFFLLLLLLLLFFFFFFFVFFFFYFLFFIVIFFVFFFFFFFFSFFLFFFFLFSSSFFPFFFFFFFSFLFSFFCDTGWRAQTKRSTMMKYAGGKWNGLSMTVTSGMLVLKISWKLRLTAE